MRRTLRRSTLSVACLVAAIGPSGLAGQDRSDADEVRDVIEGYIVGWRTADVELLRSVFATEEGVLLWPSGAAGEEALNGMTFGEILERGRRPNPNYGREWEILSLDVLDEGLAVAKVDISRSGGSYVDYLVLYRLAEGWRIVTKTYVTR